MAGYTHTSCVLDRGLDEVTRRPIYNYICVPRCNYALLASPSTSPRTCNPLYLKKCILTKFKTGVSFCPPSRRKVWLCLALAV